MRKKRASIAPNASISLNISIDEFLSNLVNRTAVSIASNNMTVFTIMNHLAVNLHLAAICRGLSLKSIGSRSTVEAPVLDLSLPSKYTSSLIDEEPMRYYDIDDQFVALFAAQLFLTSHICHYSALTCFLSLRVQGCSMCLSLRVINKVNVLNVSLLLETFHISVATQQRNRTFCWVEECR